MRPLGFRGRACSAALLAAWPFASARASQEAMGFDARGMGLADATGALIGELSPAAANPATLGWLERAELQASVRRLFTHAGGDNDLDGFSAALGLPLRHSPWGGALAVHGSQYARSSQALDTSLAVLYGTRGWRELGAKTLDVGVALKLLRRSGRGVPGSVAKLTGDFGALLRLSDDKTLGLSALNLNGPRLDLAALPDRAPAAVRLGYAQQVRRFKVVAELAHRDPAEGRRPSRWAGFGTEALWGTARHGSFAARAGLQAGSLSRSASLGGGWSRLGVRFDYALRVPFTGDSRLSHGATFSYRFGLRDPEAEYERVLKSEIQYRESLIEALRASEAKQKELGGQLERLRADLDVLQKALERRSAEKETLEEQIRLKEMRERERQAQEQMRRLEQEKERLRRMDKNLLFQEDWRAYQEFKRQGASDEALRERLTRMLRDYKGSPVDLGEAQLELQRLLAR